MGRHFECRRRAKETRWASMSKVFPKLAKSITLAAKNGGPDPDSNAPLRVAIGIHAGPAIVGAMGYREVMNVTAIGDTVNVASRLEMVAKELNASIVVSEQAVRLAGLDLSAFELRDVDIRGRAQPLQIRVVPQGATIAIPGQAQFVSAA